MFDSSAFWILGTIFRGSPNMLLQIVASWAQAHGVSLSGQNPQLITNLLHIIIQG